MSFADGSKSTIERAIEIAKGGPATAVVHIRSQLSTEGYEQIDNATSGMSIKAQLNRLIAARVAESRNV